MHMVATLTGKRLSDAIRVPERVWLDAGTELRRRIIQRTRGRNVDADGAPFEPYSPGYARAKAKKGGLTGGGRVNLTGAAAGPKMLDNMAVRASATTNPRISITFALAEKARIASYHMGEGRVDRLFFALSDEDLDYAVGFIRQRLGVS